MSSHITLTDFVSGVHGFANTTHADRILAFAWYLQRLASKNPFTASDIAHCFKESSTAPPSAVSPFLLSMAKRRRPLVLKRGVGYTLEQQALRRLDDRFGQRQTAINVHQLLAELPSRITLSDEREYLEEALVCYRSGAFRAAIVMSWNLAYAHLCNIVLARHLSPFNSQLPKSFPKADISSVGKAADFQELKESQVLHVCKSAGIISSSLHKVMKEKLDRRNISAHPSGIQVTQLTAEEFIRDLVDNVVLML